MPSVRIARSVSSRVASRPDDRAFEGDKDLADKLRDEQFVLGNEAPADHGAAKARLLPYTTPIIMLVLSVKRALSSPVILALAASVIIAMPAAVWFYHTGRRC